MFRHPKPNFTKSIFFIEAEVDKIKSEIKTCLFKPQPNGFIISW